MKLQRGLHECVVNVVNPRLPRMTEAQIGNLLSTAKAGVKEHFGKDISFSQTKEIPIQEFFSLERLPADRKKRIADDIYDFNGGTGNRYLILKSCTGRSWPKWDFRRTSS